MQSVPMVAMGGTTWRGTSPMPCGSGDLVPHGPGEFGTGSHDAGGAPANTGSMYADGETFMVDEDMETNPAGRSAGPATRPRPASGSTATRAGPLPSPRTTTPSLVRTAGSPGRAPSGAPSARTTSTAAPRAWSRPATTWRASWTPRSASTSGTPTRPGRPPTRTPSGWTCRRTAARPGSTPSRSARRGPAPTGAGSSTPSGSRTSSR